MTLNIKTSDLGNKLRSCWDRSVETENIAESVEMFNSIHLTDIYRVESILMEN